MDLLKLLTHLIIFTTTVIALWYDMLKNEVGNKKPWGRFRFFTVWNIIFQSIYFGLGILTDLTETRSNPPHRSQRCAIQKLRDLFHSCIAFPSAMFVTVYFWAIYHVNRELIWPSKYDGVLPGWYNHCLHTTVLVFIVLDKLVVRHHYPSKLAGVFTAGLCSLVYLAWVLYIFTETRVWVYPVLEVLNNQQRAAFIGLTCVSSGLFYLVGNWLTFYFWGPGPKQRVEKPKEN